METNQIYTLRDNFTIIGLTGRTGSGCTRFANIISTNIDVEKREMHRRPQDINYLEETESFDSNTIFKRKYEICYQYFKRNKVAYKTISYLHVILFYTIHYGINQEKVKTKDELVNFLNKLLLENFIKSQEGLDPDYKEAKINKVDLTKLITKHNKWFDEIKKVNKDLKKIDNLDNLYDSFFDGFEDFASDFYSLIAKTDFYLGAFFVHRLGNKIRATGNPFSDGKDLKENAQIKNIYNVVFIINKLIKSWKNKQENNSCHICIDSLRNSLEIMFLKERYSAFYMIAIHNDKRHKDRINQRVLKYSTDSKTIKNNKNTVKDISNKLISLDEIEHDASDFKEGYFFAPDVENCIQKSEIHINNPGKNSAKFNENIRRTSFYTMTEQWMKINSLILHPGIITPSNEERCMQIAFNTKFNSGCISRQVGAIVTDKNNSVKSIGWNDVPKGSISCNLRTIKDIIKPDRINKLDKSYSIFETNTVEKSYKKGGSFSQKTKDEFKKLTLISDEKGLNHSFCFKSLHNDYEGKANQVHTRSLHAEENAMLQISKFGGQPLLGGTLYTTASPCELCSKKAYQLGLKIIYIDPYPGISMKHVLSNGYNQPNAKMFSGIIGRAYNKMFEPLLSYKDELALLVDKKDKVDEIKEKELLKMIEELYNKNLIKNKNIDDFKTKIKQLLG